MFVGVRVVVTAGIGRTAKGDRFVSDGRSNTAKGDPFVSDDRSKTAEQGKRHVLIARFARGLYQCVPPVPCAAVCGQSHVRDVGESEGFEGGQGLLVLLGDLEATQRESERGARNALCALFFYSFMTTCNCRPRPPLHSHLHPLPTTPSSPRPHPKRTTACPPSHGAAPRPARRAAARRSSTHLCRAVVAHHDVHPRRMACDAPQQAGQALRPSR